MAAGVALRLGLKAGKALLKKARKSEFFKTFRKQDVQRAKKLAKPKKDEFSEVATGVKRAIKTRGRARKIMPKLSEKFRKEERLERKLGFPSSKSPKTTKKLKSAIKTQEASQSEITKGVKKLKQLRLKRRGK